MAARKKKPASSAPDGFSQAAWDKLPVSWRDAAQSKQTEELEKDIIKSVRSMSNTTFDMNNDQKLEALQNQLKDARDKVKDLKSGYTEVIAEEKAKLDYCVYLMNSRGAVVDTSNLDKTGS